MNTHKVKRHRRMTISHLTRIGQMVLLSLQFIDVSKGVLSSDCRPANLYLIWLFWNFSFQSADITLKMVKVNTFIISFHMFDHFFSYV